MARKAKIRDPVSFACHFKIPTRTLSKLGVLNPLLNADTRLFIDPLLLERSAAPEFRAGANSYYEYYQQILVLLQNSKGPGDIPWQEAAKRLRFKEVAALGLGYSVGSIAGKGIGPELTEILVDRAYEIIHLGIKDPSLFSMLPLLVDGVGPDLIGDMTSRTILKEIYEYSQRITGELGVPVRAVTFRGTQYKLARNPFNNDHSILLAPLDVLRSLPVAKDRWGVEVAMAEVARIRKRVNDALGEIWKAKTAKQRAEARKPVLQDRDLLEAVLRTMHAAATKATTAAQDNPAQWHDLIRKLAADFPLLIAQPSKKTRQELLRVVKLIVDRFQHLVEKNSLWELCWTEAKKPVKEEVIQKVFFALADGYCKNNNIDVTPEANAGPGPVDFKFSSGAHAAVVVEIKKSTNTKLIGGYTEQLDAYLDAEDTELGFYVVVDVGSAGKKFEKLLKIKNARKAAGRKVSEIIFVDARPQKSASKR